MQNWKKRLKYFWILNQWFVFGEKQYILIYHQSETTNRKFKLYDNK